MTCGTDFASIFMVESKSVYLFLLEIVFLNLVVKKIIKEE